MKFCQKCGAQIPDGAETCPNCASDPMNATPQPIAAKPVISGKAGIYFGIAALIVILALISTIIVGVGAGHMSDLQSINGNTVAEYFYQSCGTVGKGIAMFIMTFGIAFGGYFANLGLKTMKK